MRDFPQNGEPPARNGTRTIRFGAFEADLHAGEVRKSGSRIKLQDQPFKVLQILLENPGNVVSREELQSRIWPEESYGDFDHAVNVAVGKLRTALGDSADNPSFIETVPRRGYRFVAPVDGAHTSSGSNSVSTSASDSKAQAHSAAALMPAAPAAAGISGGKRILLIVLAVAVCGTLLAGGAWLGRRTVRSQPAGIQRLTVSHGTVYSARFAPDGRNILYAASWDGAPIRIFSTDLRFPGSRSFGLTSMDLLAVSSPGEVAVLTPASRRFMLSMIGTLGQMSLTGGSPRQIAEDVEWADWASDGNSLAIVRDVAGKQRLEFPIGHVLYETSGWISHPRIAPGGRQIAFLDHTTYDDDGGDVSVVDLAGHKTTLSAGWESEEGLAWSPDGGEVWFSAAQAGLQRQIYAVDLAGRLRVAFQALGGVTLQDIASDGRVLMTRDEQRAGIMASARGATREQDLSWQDWSIPVDISNDGNTLLFDEQGEQGGPNYTVATRDMQGSPPVPLGEGMAGNFSPDGAWAASTISYSQLVLLPTGAGTIRHIDRGDIQRYGHQVLWMPDGKQIIFTGNQAGHATRCFIQSIDGGKPRPITPEGVNFCELSPDGSVLAAGGFQQGEIRLYPIGGGEPRPIPGWLPGEIVVWTADPHVVYVYRPTESPVKVYRLNILTGQRQLYKEITPPDLAGLCGVTHILFSTDGRAYAYGYVRLLSELYLVTGLR